MIVLPFAYMNGGIEMLENEWKARGYEILDPSRIRVS
jgi:hypothetical protein